MTTHAQWTPIHKLITNTQIRHASTQFFALFHNQQSTLAETVVPHHHEVLKHFSRTETSLCIQLLNICVLRKEGAKKTPTQSERALLAITLEDKGCPNKQWPRGTSEGKTHNIISEELSCLCLRIVLSKIRHMPSFIQPMQLYLQYYMHAQKSQCGTADHCVRLALCV